MVHRDVALAELTGGVVHIAHLSARQSLDGVRYGKARGVRVTCEVTPHHFGLTDEMLAAPRPYDTNVKMNPPLRDDLDREAMLQGPSTARWMRLPPTTPLITTTKSTSSSTRLPSVSPVWRPRYLCLSIDSSITAA